MALFVIGMYVVLGTLSLSGAQVADRDLGRFEASVGYGSVVLPPGADGFEEAAVDRALAAGASEARVVLSATDVQLLTTPARDLTMWEGDWQARPYPDRYSLLTGRWPRAPGEVVVADPGDISAVVGGDLPVLGGRVQFRVVGTADDRYARTPILLAASGTWSRLEPGLARGYPALNAQPFLLWSGGDPAKLVEAFVAVVRDDRFSQGTEAGIDVSEFVASTLVTREQLAGRPERSWIARSPAGYTVPSLLLPIGAVLLVFGLHDRRFRRSLTALRSAGVPLWTAVASLTLATLLWCLAAGAIGALAGVAAGAGARAAIAEFREIPAGPIGGVAGPVLRLLGLLVLAALGAGLALVRARPAHLSRRLPASRAASRVGRRIRDARHLLAVAAWCGTAVYATRVDSPSEAMILTGLLTVAVLLVVPEVLDLVLRLLPEQGPRHRLARRQLIADRRRASTALVALTVLLGGSLGYLTLLDTLIRTANEQAYPEVLSGQVLLADRSSVTFPPPAAVLEAVEASGLLAGRPRWELVYLLVADESSSRSANLEGSHRSLLAVDHPAHAEQLVGNRLTDVQVATLAGGGILIWADAQGDAAEAGQATLVVRNGEQIAARTPSIPAAGVEVPLVDWRIGTDGVLLRSTAEELSLPLPERGPVMVTGVSSSQALAAQDAVARGGLDARAVRTYRPPPPAIPPAALLATAASLVLLVLVAVMVAVRGQSRVLRGYLARLIAIGVPPVWARHVLLYQLGVLIATSTLLGLVIAALPASLLALQISGFVLSIPWRQLLTLLVAIYASAGTAALLALLRLRPREGTGTDL